MAFKYDEFKRIRKEKRWSLGNLGKAVGMSRRALTNWENGHSEPKESNIKKLASFLAVPVSMISDLQDTAPISEKQISDSASEFMSFYKEETDNRKKIEEVINGIKILENKLNESSLVIKAITSSINSPIYIKDLNQKYVLANNAFKENLGLHSSFRISGKNDADLLPAADANKNTKEDQKIIESGESIVNSEKFIPGSRKSKWGLISKYPIFDSEQKIAGVLGLFYDITERTKTDNLRKLMETAFLKNSSNVLYIYNSKFKLIYLSDSFETVYGYSKEALLKDSDLWLNNCLHPNYREKFINYRNLKNWPQNIKYKSIDIKGRIKWIEAKIHKFSFMNMECLACIERDISSQKSLAWKNIALYEIINSLPNTFVWSGVLNSNGFVDFDLLTQNIEKITGYSHDNFLTHKINLSTLFPEDTLKIIGNWIKNSQKALSIEHTLLCNNNKILQTTTKIFSVMNENNEYTYFGIHTIKE